jgi:hypothetical protein
MIINGLNMLQPISEAPKDGRRFWGIIDDDAIAMFWHPKFEAFVSSYRRMSMAAGIKTIDGETYEDHSPVKHYPKQFMMMPKELE